MANRLTTRIYPDGLNDSFGYDPASRLLSAACARYNNTMTRGYDNAGRLLIETLTDAIIGSASVNYGYDAANRQTTITYPNNKQVVRGYTDRNQLVSVSYDGASVATFGYDLGMRRQTTTFGNGKVETRTYRPDNLPATQSVPDVTGFAYGWDTNKRKTQQNDAIIPQNVQDYGYDDEDRLIDYTRNNGDSQTWGLSLEGDWNNTTVNGLTENRTHNAVHELTARDATGLTYDDKGNLTGNPAREQTYQWDYENRMRLLIKSGSGSYNYSYRYDALGRRVGWTRKNGTNPNGGGQTKTMVFVSAGMQEIAEYEQGTLKRIYVFGSYIDEPLMMMPVGGGPVKKYYYHANNLYNVTAITDKNGVVVERYNYSPYGEATVLDATGTTVLGASTIANPWTFTGRRLDAETGLMYYRARYYDVELGRFVGRDPFGYVDGLSLYMAYMVPNGLDPFGLVEEIDVQIAEGILLHHQKMLSEALCLIENYAQKLTACPPNNLTAAQHNTIRSAYQSLNQDLPRLQQNVRNAQLSLLQLKALWAAEAAAASDAVATIGGAPAGALLTASGTYGIAQAAAGWTIVGAVAVGSTATGYGMGSISVPGGDGVSYHDYWGGAMYKFCPWCFGGKQ